jgi:hypothetical protein
VHLDKNANGRIRIYLGELMDKKILSQLEYSGGEIAAGISICTDLLQAAAEFVFSLLTLETGTYTIQTRELLPDHRVIIGDPKTLLLKRPYVVGFYGIRSPDPGGTVTEDLRSVDDRLIETLGAFGVGLYNTARLGGEYVNTAVLSDRYASQRWAAENSLHQAASNKLAPRCYRKVLKFTGDIDGWPKECRFNLDEVILLE